MWFLTTDWFWLMIFGTNLVRGLSNKEIVFRNKGAVSVQLAPFWIRAPRKQNQSVLVVTMLISTSSWESDAIPPHYLRLRFLSNILSNHTTFREFVGIRCDSFTILRQHFLVDNTCIPWVRGVHNSIYPLLGGHIPRWLGLDFLLSLSLSLALSLFLSLSLSLSVFISLSLFLCFFLSHSSSYISIRIHLCIYI